MRKIVSGIVISFLFFGICSAQAQFQLAVGGTGVNDIAYSITKTTDGGFVMAGQTASFGAGSTDFYILKFNSDAALQWTKTIGGAIIDKAYCIIQTSDGGYAVSGFSNSFSPNRNAYIIKLDAAGTLQWNRIVLQSGIAQGYSLIQTSDGGYAVAMNNAASHLHIIKFTADGTLQWNKEVEGTNNQSEDMQRFSIKQTSDGGYAIGGSTSSFGAGNFDMYLVKLDSSGSLQWSRTVGGTGLDNGYSLTLTSDGGYVLAGQTNTYGAGGIDMYLVKINAGGSLQWTRTVGGTGNDWAWSIIQTTDGGYAVTGNTQSFGQGVEMYFVKLDAGGTLQWSKTIGGSGPEYSYSVLQASDGSYIMAGYTSTFGAGAQDVYIVKIDVNGNTCGSTSPASLSGSGGIIESPNPQVVSAILSVMTPVPTISSGGTLTNICNIVGIVKNENELPRGFELYQNYPNPFNPSTAIKFLVVSSSTVKVVIYDALGKELETVVNEQLNAGTYEVYWNASNYPSGVYFYQFSTGDFSETKSMVLIK